MLLMMDDVLNRTVPCGTCRGQDGQPTGRVPSGKWLAFVRIKQAEVSAEHDAKHQDPKRRAQAAKDLAHARASLQGAFPCGVGDDGEPLWKNDAGEVEKCPQTVVCNTCRGTKQQIVVPSPHETLAVLKAQQRKIDALEAALKKAGLM